MSASLFNKLSFIFSLIAMLMAWISFVMPAWGFDQDPDDGNGYGLWRRCGQSDISPSCVDLTGWNLGELMCRAVSGGLALRLLFAAFLTLNVLYLHS